MCAQKNTFPNEQICFDSINIKEKKTITLSPFQRIDKDTISLDPDDELIFDEYTAMGKPAVYDALHSFNSRRSDKFGGYINVKINAGLERIRKKGFNSDIKQLYIQIDPLTLTVYWYAIIGPSKDNFSYVRVDSRGSAGGGKIAVEKQLAKMHELYPNLVPIKFLELNENVTACYHWNGKQLEEFTSFVNIQQYFFKYGEKIKTEKIFDQKKNIHNENNELIFEEFDTLDSTIDEDVSIIEFKTIEKEERKKNIKRNISKVYRVKSGDNLSKIALKFNTTSEYLKKQNSLKNDKIQINQVLIIKEN